MATTVAPQTRPEQLWSDVVLASTEPAVIVEIVSPAGAGDHRNVGCGGFEVGAGALLLDQDRRETASKWATRRANALKRVVRRLRELVAGGRLVHDGRAELAAQVGSAMVVESAAGGLTLSTRSGRSDLLRAAAWALGPVGHRAQVVGLGCGVVDYDSCPDLDPAAKATADAVRPFTMTSTERIFAVVEAVRYISRFHIPGAVVECGVWRGGSTMAAARTLIECGDDRRDLWLFDTFEGMSAPQEIDRDLEGRAAADLLAAEDRDTSLVWAHAELSEVEANLRTTGYDPARLHFVKGPVEHTVPDRAPQQIALLRLDTDWYESTRHELAHLWSGLARTGYSSSTTTGTGKAPAVPSTSIVAASDRPILLNRTRLHGPDCRTAVVHHLCGTYAAFDAHRLGHGARGMRSRRQAVVMFRRCSAEWRGPRLPKPEMGPDLRNLVGDTGFEPVTSSVSRKRATAAPIARGVLRGGSSVRGGYGI